MLHSSFTIGVALVAAATVSTLPGIADDKPSKRQKPKIRISKETTYLTKPLDKDGIVDYAAALNAMASKGVTPQTNAAAGLAQILGPAKFPAEIRREFFAKLGVPVPSKEGRYFLSMADFARHAAGRGADAYASALFDEYENSMTGPWSPRDLPRLAAWMKYNQKPLESVVKATLRKRWFNPIAGVSGNEKGTLLWADMTLTHETRECVRALAARALLAVQEGRNDQAQRDLLACHRLARLVAQGPFLIDALVGNAIEFIACMADRAMLQSGRLSEKQLAAYQSALARLGLFPPLSRVTNSERFAILDAIAYVAHHGPEGLQSVVVGIDGDDSLRGWFENLKWRLVMSLVDWDFVLKTVNQEYDRLLIVMNNRRYADWKTAAAEYERHLGTIREDVRLLLFDNKALFRRIATGKKNGREVISELAANAVTVLLMPAFDTMRLSRDRTRAKLQLTIIAIALERHRKATGKFPDRLSDLQPRYLKKLPQDLFTEKPFRYKPSKTGYLLYSVGPNMKDDGGRPMNVENDDDDVAVRMKPAKRAAFRTPCACGVMSRTTTPNRAHPLRCCTDTAAEVRAACCE